MGVPSEVIVDVPYDVPAPYPVAMDLNTPEIMTVAVELEAHREQASEVPVKVPYTLQVPNPVPYQKDLIIPVNQPVPVEIATPVIWEEIIRPVVHEEQIMVPETKVVTEYVTEYVRGGHAHPRVVRDGYRGTHAGVSGGAVLSGAGVSGGALLGAGVSGGALLSGRG